MKKNAPVYSRRGIFLAQNSIIAPWAETQKYEMSDDRLCLQSLEEPVQFGVYFIDDGPEIFLIVDKVELIDIDD